MNGGSERMELGKEGRSVFFFLNREKKVPGTDKIAGVGKGEVCGKRTSHIQV